MHLVREKTRATINVGDVIHDLRGDAAVVTGWEIPKHGGSTGRVYIKEMDARGMTGSYYPSVYKLKWDGTSGV